MINYQYYFDTVGFYNPLLNYLLLYLYIPLKNIDLTNIVISCTFVPGPVLGSGNIAANKRQNSCLYEKTKDRRFLAHVLVGIKQIKSESSLSVYHLSSCLSIIIVSKQSTPENNERIKFQAEETGEAKASVQDHICRVLGPARVQCDQMDGAGRRYQEIRSRQRQGARSCKTLMPVGITWAVFGPK